MDLNATVRRLREHDARLRRNGLLNPPNPELWPLHIRVKMNPEKIPEFIVRYCHAAGVQIEDVFSSSRLKQFIIPRHVLMWFIAENSHLTINAVGRMFGRHHATIVHARENVKKLIDVEDKLYMFHVNLTSTLAPEVWPLNLREHPEEVG